MNQIIRQCYKGIAYCHFHPHDKEKREALEKLILIAWNLGYPRTYFNYQSKDTNSITINDMTEWEIKYVLDKESTI